MTDRILQLLREQPRLAELAAYPFEFDLDRTDHVEAVRLASGASLEPVAGDDTGGTYFVCGGPGGPVLYASSDGMAGLIGCSVTEALEIRIGLPGGLPARLSPEDGEAAILAEVEEADEELREYVPELDAHRVELRKGLGLPDRSPVELFTMRHAASLRTEPDHLLLNADEGRAYELLGRPPRTPLREVVLAPGRADLRRMRTDRGTWGGVAGDAVRRAAALRAAQYDRQDDDLPLLRHLLAYEAAEAERSEELRLAAVLIGRHGLAEDVPLLAGSPLGSADGTTALAEQARELDERCFGEDPDAESELTWVTLARRQGLTEHARAALIRMLDDAGSDAPRLYAIAQELAVLGDFVQAARAQDAYVSLQCTAWERATAGRALAEYERRAGNLPGAWRALERARTTLEEGDRPDWRRLGIGGMITAEYLLIALAAAASDDVPLARDAMARGKALLKEKTFHPSRELGPLARKAKWAVARLPRP